MSKEVQAAVGTERQFAKQPELPYALRLNPLNVSSGISQSVDYDAQRLASALGNLPSAIGNLNVAIAKHNKEQAETTVNADKILFGKTKEDIQNFDTMSALEHEYGHKLSHNKYAVAMVDKAAGKMASTYAKQQWADMPESQKPKSVEEQVKLFQQLLQDNRKTFGENIKNQQAFDEGYYNAGIADTLKVANEADERINDETHFKLMSSAQAQFADLVYSGVQGDEFNTQATGIIRQLEWGARDIKEFAGAVKANLGVIADKDLDGTRLKQFEEMTAFGGSKLKDIVSFAPYKQKIAQNCRKEIARQAYEKYKLPNGGFNWKAYNDDKKNRPASMFSSSIPDVSIPISQGDNPNLENLSDNMKGAISKIGGVLFNLGYGDVMQLTSGWRSVEHNAEVGGAENSYHTTGEALDIYLGTDLSSEQLNQLKTTFAPYFGEVLFHDAGSGNHLHLADYKGGISQQPTESQEEDLSYSAYDPDRNEAIDKALRTKVNDAKRQYNQEQQQIKNDVVKNMYNASSASDAYSIIDNSSLSPQVKVSLKKNIDTFWKKQDAAKNGKLKGEALKIANYESPMSGTNVFSDMEKAEEYERLVKEHKENGKEFTEAQQRMYNAAARRLCWYWAKTGATQQKKEEPTTVTKPNSNFVYDDYGTTPEQPKEQGQFTKELKDAVNELKAQNYSEVQINAFLEKYAKNNNMDVSQLQMLLKE